MLFRSVSFGWFGDGSAARGDVHESMNFAGVMRLPMVFCCTNNLWAYSTPSHLEYACEHLADRAAAYGFEGVVVDGTDVLAVYREAKRAADKARDGGSVAQFLARYADFIADDAVGHATVRRGNAPIRYLDYDWDLNDATR